MDFLNSMNHALDYIEAHLTCEINYNDLAKAAACSAYTFQRFFTYVSGVSLAEYIRRRRLSCAAFDLQHSDIKILDLAIKYGYVSDVSFARAFQILHGITPTEARRGFYLKVYPKLVFNFSIQGDTALDYKIVTKESFRMIGVKETISKVGEANLTLMPQIWLAHHKDRLALADLSAEETRPVYGLTMNYKEDSFDYCLAAISHKPVPPGMMEIQIPQSTWAIFQCRGALPKSQYETWQRIFAEWLPICGYDLAESPEIEWYAKGDINSDSYKSEIWLPIHRA